MTMSPTSTNVVWHHATVTRQRREQLNGHASAMLWFTGLSASGKSTLAHAVEESLHQQGCRTYVLDGDNVRHGLNSNLGFSPEDRTENLRRIGEVGKLMVDAGIITLAAFISPYQKERERVRSLFPHGDFIEIYCNASINVCEQRDPKGMYQKARKGLIKDFTGISAPYEVPANPELEVDTGSNTLEDSVDRVIQLLARRGLIAAGDTNREK
ncbi:MAG: adenylyl-sulfate kinase [Gammaproteobacteria bacterium]|nr:adenylyl-sulfate kinase [Gammaproteobacteria bacterium]MBU1655471.1 adenylyl-sulfate kinase [Gammaproteobacteria bacterium]MBU1959606.1 adenylyl-sulfate kinase [Gammaproteobacteria bacterium]